MSLRTSQEQGDVAGIEAFLVQALEPLKSSGLVRKVLGYGGDPSKDEDLLQRLTGDLPGLLVAYNGAKFERSGPGLYRPHGRFSVLIVSDRLTARQGEDRRLGIYELLRCARALLAEATFPETGRVKLLEEKPVIARPDVHVFALEIEVPWLFDATPARGDLEEFLRLGESLSPTDPSHPFEADGRTPAGPGKVGGVKTIRTS